MSSSVATHRRRPANSTTVRRSNSTWLYALDLRMIRSIFQPLARSTTLNCDSWRIASRAVLRSK